MMMCHTEMEHELLGDGFGDDYDKDDDDDDGEASRTRLKIAFAFREIGIRRGTNV